ncbi:Fungal specific transcription factor domain containing protein [Drechmeria coniospora]|uniref:Fungal specific transcription factor domain containing protein n=1 Tax=Drechmeria coniospora TaxID=98403 RepID=A0A151GSX6_DRECN|nr:Fungal specific transcription factor domain containing protein [Drechmeria coniospora]KYK60226.1 Fungal specific transcription factor domain containing protein [Drechmeria coniospora]
MQSTPSPVLPTHATADSGHLFDTSLIGSSDQACKECRRRKARCNRALPTCNLCVKYRRHCLYEKHARTPLTRKHLTEVEARLERAEVLLRQVRALVPPHLRSWENPSSTAAPDSVHFSESLCHEKTVAGGQARSRLSPPILRQHQRDTGDVDHQKMLERPPLEDFEWSEKDSPYACDPSPDGLGPDPSGADDVPLTDGMASLTVNEGDSGYLGIASGAALLRLLEPNAPRQNPSRLHQEVSPSMTSQPNPNRHIAETMIDAYFRHYHVCYPLVHEPSFRAQYSEVISRPHGPSWTALAYVVAAIGVWTSATSSADKLDLALFAQARSILGFNFLELGNLSLVQALILASNYQQKRDKPNSGYNYLGLSSRMAMGLGLHKEFQGWNIAPLSMEIRRRVWWTLCSFDIGASITFSRPDVWPYKGVEVSYPLNVNDSDLTAASDAYPLESSTVTPYSAVATQARFHVATHECYEKVISKPFPSADELLRLERTKIEGWKADVPAYFAEEAIVPRRYALPHAVMAWRLRNLRIIMYRPFVIRRALRRKPDADEASATAYDRCLFDAQSTIDMIERFWHRHEHNRLSAWYALYFLFQAALIPCVCLRNDPTADAAVGWRGQISTTLRLLGAMSHLNKSCSRCHGIITGLCGRYLDGNQSEMRASQSEPQSESAVESGIQPADERRCGSSQPVGESPETQINSVFPMMWPNLPPMEVADAVMGDDTGWMEFLRAGSEDEHDSNWKETRDSLHGVSYIHSILAGPNECYAQIDRYEVELNAFISQAPRSKVLRVAGTLDEERRMGHVRSPLHRTPIVLKDCLITASNLDMSTAAGPLSFVGSKAAKNSAIAQRLIDASLIILGKTNMTEFAVTMLAMIMPEWSSHGGQTLSPQVRKFEENETILSHWVRDMGRSDAA